MAEHNVTFEIFYSGAWRPAPVLTRTPMAFRRGTDSVGNDTDPQQGKLTLDDTLQLYAPRSVVSPLYGLIGQNTPARITVDGSVRLSGEVASWKPTRPVKGSRWTPVEIGSVLRRLGRGADPLRSALYRANVFLGPDAYWAFEDGRGAPVAGSALVDVNPLQISTLAPTWADATDLAGSAPLPRLLDDLADWPEGLLSGLARGSSATAWSASVWFKAVMVGNLIGQVVTLVAWGGNPTGSNRNFQLSILKDNGLGFTYTFDVDTSIYCFASNGNPFDGQWHHMVGTATQNGANLDMQLFVDGVKVDVTTTSSAYTLKAVSDVKVVRWYPDSDPSTLTLHLGHLAFFPRVLADAEVLALYRAGLGYVGETAADRFSRLCAEEGITATVVGTAAETAAMGPQQIATMLDQLDEIARTDDASIFETRSVVGLTMRTGPSRQNQAPALTVYYRGQIVPELEPVYGDEGIRNDATARNPAGSTRRVQQSTGPRNVLAPGTDPQGVGRYQTSIDANPQDDESLSYIAGWTVVRGTFDGTWFAEITVDLDAAPGLIAAVNAVDIGDVVALADLPSDEALDTFEGVVIGIGEELPPKRRLVTFYVIPAAPYRVGKLAQTTGDTDAFVGDMDPDGSTTAGAVAAGAASFSVATPSGPLWSTVADDYPLDVLVGGQRVSISAVAGGASPQTFTVQPTGRPVRYAVAAGATVLPYQPITLTP